jgi:putative ABC transport system permease protein
MEGRELLRQAVESLRESPGRALTSWLAVSWAAGGMILLLACGFGFREHMMRQLREYGRGSVNVTAGVTSSGFPGYPVGRRVRFSRAAIADAERATPRVKAILPVHRREEGYSLLSSRGAQRWYQLDGVDARYLWYRNFRLAAGRAFSEDDVDRARAVAVIGHDVALELFGDVPWAPGRRLRIDGHSFEVIGVCSRKQRQYVNPGRPDNRLVLVPITTAEGMLGFDPMDVHQLLIYPSGPDGEQALRAVLEALGPRLGFHPDDLDAVSWQDTRRLSRVVDVMTGGFLVFVGVAGTVTLLVAAMGAAAFQLAILVSRVQEIGIAKALGARNRLLALQTVVESLLLTGSAALLGTGAGAAASWALGVLAASRDLPVPRVSAALVVFVGGALVAVACVAALIPALRVRSMEPSAAFRST